MNRFVISWDEWKANREEAIKHVKEKPTLLFKRQNKGGFEGTYFTWLHVWKWFKHKYNDSGFYTTEIGNGYIKGRLEINGQVMGELALTLEQFKRANGEVYSETPEQLQMRIMVKLVANITGYGIHLWEK